MKTIICSCGIKLKESERSQHGALFNNHEFFDISLMPERTKKGRALAITLITLCLLVNVSNSHVFAAHAAHTGHTQAYIEGFKGAMKNDTMTTSCGLSGNGDKYSNCISGFDDGQVALEKTTVPYSVGYDQGKNDSSVSFYDDNDACKQYLGSDYSHTGCQDGYRSGNNENVLQPNASVLVQKYKDLVSYRAGFLSGAKNGNETSACGIFKNRALAICQQAYNYGTTPTSYEPTHCSANDVDANSCFNYGKDAGYASTMKEIIRCHMVLTVPPSGHSARFDMGFKKGWLEANHEADNGNHTYGTNNCTKYY
ncbi:MAG: hypothetical protein WA667_13875 [Candidatus Nitrosopolaris sp.]